MADSVYKVIELVGSSDKSWEDAARAEAYRQELYAQWEKEGKL